MGKEHQLSMPAIGIWEQHRAHLLNFKSFMDYIIITPRIHHFHHSTKLEEAKNYGTIIPFWDLLLGTYYNRKGEVEDVGIVKDDPCHIPRAA